MSKTVIERIEDLEEQTSLRLLTEVLNKLEEEKDLPWSKKSKVVKKIEVFKKIISEKKLNKEEAEIAEEASNSDLIIALIIYLRSLKSAIKELCSTIKQELGVDTVFAEKDI